MYMYMYIHMFIHVSIIMYTCTCMCVISASQGRPVGHRGVWTGNLSRQKLVNAFNFKVNYMYMYT